MWEDITNIVLSAASALGDLAYAKSPMVAVEDFSLFEAMSATELFDEKMDPGNECVPYALFLSLFLNEICGK